VRGALEQLKRRGLVTATRGGGTRLREPAGDPAMATLAPPELAIALAGRLLAGATWAALLRPAASTRPDLRQALHALLVPLAAAAEPGRTEIALYAALIEASGNETFRALFDLLRQPLSDWLARMPAAQPATWRTLVATLEAGDGAGAAAIVQGRLDPIPATRPADDRPAVVRQAAE
jgi:DNA-binding FadR family transcriptional regulator